MKVHIEWSLSPYNPGTCVFINDGFVTFTLSHPSEKKQSFIVYRNPNVVVYLGVVALVTGYREHFGLTIEEVLTQGLLHELCHVAAGGSHFCGGWNEFLVSVMR